MPEDLSAGIDEVQESCITTTTYYQTDGVTKALETIDEVESSVCCNYGLKWPGKSYWAACDVEYYITFVTSP